MEVNEDLRRYVMEYIFPQYTKNEEGHGIDHISCVIERCFELSKGKNINLDILFTIAAYHDIAHHIDPQRHEIISAEIMFCDENLKRFFYEPELIIIKEAIEDHQASSKKEPRSIYGKLISSADKSTCIETALGRAYLYGKDHFPNMGEEDQQERSYQYLIQKFGRGKEPKIFIEDQRYREYLEKIQLLLSDRANFEIEYQKAIGKIQKEKAKQFAIQAHKGQIRKTEPDKPRIVHPLSVGDMLEEYGYDDHVVAAGYLHDVVEDTNYTLEDIEHEFGKDIASLVQGVSEPNKSLSWEERKQHTIDVAKSLPLRNKFVEAADKINNLEDMWLLFEKLGKRDFSFFKRGEDKHKWYQTGVYNSLILGEDEKEPIFIRLKQALDHLFGDNQDDFLRDVVFADNITYYENLKKINAQKIELKQLNALCGAEKPFVIEFCGTPRTEKMTISNTLYDYFETVGFRTKLVQNTSLYDHRPICIDEMSKQLRDYLADGSEIVLLERSIHEKIVENYRQFQSQDITQERFHSINEGLSELSREFIDLLVVEHTEPLAVLKREYNHSLSLEEGHSLTLEDIIQYNDSLNAAFPVFEKSVDSIIPLDTTNLTHNDSALSVVREIMPVMRKSYISRFNQTINK